MRKWKSMLLCCLVLSGFASIGLAETIVIDFDDYNGSLMPIPAGYAGFTSWGSFAYSSIEQPPVYIPYSGTTYAISVGGEAPIVFGEAYVFLGAWFISYPGNGIAYELYADGAVVYTSETMMLADEYQWQPSGYDGLVDEVKVLYAVGSNTWTMDDFTYETEMVAVESATWRTLKDLYR